MFYLTLIQLKLNFFFLEKKFLNRISVLLLPFLGKRNYIKCFYRNQIFTLIIFKIILDVFINTKIQRKSFLQRRLVILGFGLIINISL